MVILERVLKSNINLNISLQSIEKITQQRKWEQQKDPPHPYGDITIIVLIGALTERHTVHAPWRALRAHLSSVKRRNCVKLTGRQTHSLLFQPTATLISVRLNAFAIMDATLFQFIIGEFGEPNCTLLDAIQSTLYDNSSFALMNFDGADFTLFCMC